MLRVSEFSDTAVSPHTAVSSSSLGMSFCGLRSRCSSTRNAFGSTGNTSPAFTIENSRSRTSASPNLKTNDLPAITSPSWLDLTRAERVHSGSEEHTSELQSPCNLVRRLLLEEKKKEKPAPSQVFPRPQDRHDADCPVRR